MSHYESLITVFISVVPYERKSTVIISKISQCFVFICNQMNEAGYRVEEMQPIIVRAFDQSQLMKTVP